MKFGNGGKRIPGSGKSIHEHMVNAVARDLCEDAACIYVRARCNCRHVSVHRMYKLYHEVSANAAGQTPAARKEP